MSHPQSGNINEKTLGNTVNYVSTRGSDQKVGFQDTLLTGLAPDGGLYVPTDWPQIGQQSHTLAGPYEKDAAALMSPFIDGDIDISTLTAITRAAYAQFGHEDVAPLVEIGDGHWLLELFHGPTLSFKDFALQVLGGLFEHVLKQKGEHVTIVGATSGDTGSAAIAACRGRPNIDIFILHPLGRVSDVQRRQMTSVMAENIHNVAIEGTFDDCQKLVKEMFSDETFRNELALAAVNSINWARVVAQTVYYHVAASRLANGPLSFAVPTGNFGDVYAGYVAHRTGLPLNRLIVATNQNDILAQVLTTGRYWSGRVASTITPSMDIQVASNFERLIFDVCSCDSNKTSKLMNDLHEHGEFKLENNELKKIKENFYSESLSETETKSVIEEVYKNERMLIDPHTAVAFGAASKMSLEEDTIILATAHPSKFSDVVMKKTSIKPELPEDLKSILLKKEKYDKLPKNLIKIQNYILERI